jgi:hypothetical protein
MVKCCFQAVLENAIALRLLNAAAADDDENDDGLKKHFLICIDNVNEA